MLGEAFKIIRIFNDLTQDELARTLGISAGYLSLIEADKRTPTMDIISRFAEHFKIPVSSLMLFSEQLGPRETAADKGARMAFGRKLITMLSTIDRMAE